jgi:hypothetical protein
MTGRVGAVAIPNDTAMSGATTPVTITAPEIVFKRPAKSFVCSSRIFDIAGERA